MALRWWDGMGLSPPSSTVVALVYGVIDPMHWKGAPHVPLVPISVCPCVPFSPFLPCPTSPYPSSHFPIPRIPMSLYPWVPMSPRPMSPCVLASLDHHGCHVPVSPVLTPPHNSLVPHSPCPCISGCPHAYIPISPCPPSLPHPMSPCPCPSVSPCPHTKPSTLQVRGGDQPPH